MKRLLVLLSTMLLIAGALAHAQEGFVPMPTGAFTQNAGVWAPMTSGSGSNPLGYVPPPAALYCQASPGVWTPCTGTGGGSSLPTATAAGQSLQSSGASSTYVPVPNQNLYFFSILNDSNLVGPETFTSTLGTLLANPLSKDGGTPIVTTSGGMRDERLLHVGTEYFYSYSVNGVSNSIGLKMSSDMQNWTTVTTPNWSAYFQGSENSAWNGGWWFDGTNYWMFWGACVGGGNCTPYYVQFNPASQTFGTPQAISFGTSPPFTYNIVMTAFTSGGTNYALIQSKNSGGTPIVALASFSSLSGSWTIPNGWVQLVAVAGSSGLESGAEIADPVTGFPDVYFVDFNGGQVYLTQANSTNAATTTWSTPRVMLPYQNSGGGGSLPADWVDVVPLNDLQSQQNLLALRSSTLPTFPNGLIATGGPVWAAGQNGGPIFNKYQGVLPHISMDYLASAGGRFTSFGPNNSTAGNYYWYSATLNQGIYNEVASVTGGNNPVWNFYYPVITRAEGASVSLSADSTTGSTPNLYSAFQAYGPVSIQGNNSKTPTSAWAIGFNVPGGTPDTNTHFDVWNGTTWNNGFTVNNSTLATAFAGAVTAPSVNGTLLLTGATSTITGTALTATCDSGTATVTGAVVGHPVAVSSTTGADVGGAFDLRASVTSTNTVTVYVCGTGTPSSLAYNVVVF